MTGSLPAAQTAGAWAERRRFAGLLIAPIGLAGLTAALVPVRTDLALASIVLLYLLIVVATAVVGGLTASLAAAVASDLVVNFFFVRPYHTFTTESQDQLITLVVYVLVASTVSLAMDLAARQRAAAVRSGVEATLLARISAQPVGEGSLQDLLGHVRDALHMESAAMIESASSPGVPNGDTVVAVSGRPLTGNPALTVNAGDGFRLVAEGPAIFAPDRRFLARLGAAAVRTLQAERLAAEAAHARELAEIDRLRAALLAAVGHDLRTPLAGIKAAVSSLRNSDLRLSAAAGAELLATIEESSDRMATLIENLLAMSRLQAGALSVNAHPLALDEVVAAAMLHSAGDTGVELDVPDDLPLAVADAGLLERVIANLIDNACRISPSSSRVQVVGRARANSLQLQIIDHGPGVPAADRTRMFVAFQRTGDHTTTGGLGLGLAIAHGFTEAMNGTITPTETPGGGLTMTITLPAAP